MNYDPDIERFFQELKSGRAAADEADAAAASSGPSIPKRIVVLAEPDGDVVAHYTEFGKFAGEFVRVQNDEIYFHYAGDERRWHVNKSMSAFCEAAEIFNRCCELHADDEDSENEAVWSVIATQMRREFESIEPLGDAETALWSATVNDTEGGLLSLY